MASCRLIIQDEVNVKLEGLEVDVRRKIANALKFEVIMDSMDSLDSWTSMHSLKSISLP